jgi:hypothetical protein
MTTTTTDRLSQFPADSAYPNNTDFLEDLHRFITALIAQSRLGLSDYSDFSASPPLKSDV